MNSSPSSKLSSLLVAGAVAALIGAGAAPAAATTTAPAAAAQVRQVQQTQAAAPSGKLTATRNRLYSTGVIATSRCAAGQIRPGSSASYRAFMTKVNTCLNNTWARVFKKARLPFAKPRLRFVTGRASTQCGKWPTGADGYYCSGDRTMYIGLTKRTIREAFELGSAKLMAHEYAHHVQTISGIGPKYYFPAHNSARGSAKLQLSRRFELQADCMASAFLRSVRTTLPVIPAEWNGTLDWTRKNGSKSWPTNDHGRGSSQAYWMTRGFNGGGAASCNTWTASSSRVA